MAVETVTVSADYCFGDSPLRLSNLGKVNFIFAPNGSGKTTISSALANQPTAPDEKAVWSVAPTDLPIRVFNEAYRSRVLTEHVDGIFTMGDESKGVNEKIEEAKARKRERAENRNAWLESIGSDSGPSDLRGLLGDIAQERKIVRDATFEAHKSIPKSVVSVVFKGFRNDREKFLTEVLRRSSPDQSASANATWDSLETRAKSLTSDKTTRQVLPDVSISSLITLDEKTDMSRAISSRGSGEFAELIQRLANEDWVSEGRKYIHAAQSRCPFCQEVAPSGLEEKLAQYFAGGFDDALKRANEIEQAVAPRAEDLRQQLSRLEAAVKKDTRIDAQPFETAISKIRTAIELLIEKVRDKRLHPTRAVEVNDIDSQVNELAVLVQNKNVEIDEYNQIIANSSSEYDRLVEEGWSLFLSETAVQNAIKRFSGIVATKDSQIANLRASIARSKEEDRKDEEVIVGLRGSISNTIEVAERINKLLKSMGFHRFHVDVDEAVSGGYRIVREDGASAFASLSEGEKSFICFAYFWESLFGSAISGGDPEDVVAVIDDPISSLDSDSLFVVAAYIRHAADLVIKGSTNLRQLMVLTHNTQFHHEAAYSVNRHGKEERHYYRLMKGVDGTTVLKDDENICRIRGTYPVLWDSVVEAARSEDDSAFVQVGVFNIVRRIIEGYFKTVGNVKDYHRQNDLAPVDERLISMFHIWASSGSHTIVDDIDQTIDVGGTKRFLMLFRRYFDLEGHSAHFDMMLAASGGEDLAEAGGIFSRYKESG